MKEYNIYNDIKKENKKRKRGLRFLKMKSALVKNFLSSSSSSSSSFCFILF
ncbi:MAG: hypothetical protein M5E90_08630 [Asgard group archaeon]|nr:hypothetical protein [Asgard group archaeon]